jgi:5-hydroxyisourate hydrolase
MASGGPTDGSATISTHVLDVERGGPAAGITVTLFRLAEDGRPIRMTQAITNADGRIADLLERPLQAGDYRLRFDSREDAAAFFRSIVLDFRVTDTSRSYHVPLLLAPFSMTAYRGS